MASSGQDHGSSFFDWCLGAFIFGAVDVIVQGRSWSLFVVCIVAALVSLILKAKWGKIGEKFPQITTWAEQIARNPRFQRSTVILIVGCLGIYLMVYLHSLRSDVDAYLIPRTVSSEQAKRIRGYLAEHPKGIAKIRVVQGDLEAFQFAAELLATLQKTDWTVNGIDNIVLSPAISDPMPSDLGPDGKPRYKNIDQFMAAHDAWLSALLSAKFAERYAGSGLCVEENANQRQQQASNPSRPDAATNMHDALEGAGISNCTGGDFDLDKDVVYIAVGHRPLVIGQSREPILFRVEKWINGLVFK